MLWECYFLLSNVAKDCNLSAINLNNDFDKFSNWTFNCQMSFNRDPCKQAQQIIFSHKFHKSAHPLLVISNGTVNRTTTQKNLGLVLDSKLDLHKHLKYLESKITRTTGLLCKLRKNCQDVTTK